MSLPFDATLKDIVPDHATDYAGVFRLPKNKPVTPLNVDLSTVSATSDVAFGYGEPLDEIVDINFQSGADPFADWRFHLYNPALGHHFHVPVRSLAVLLRPAADHPNLTGKRRYGRGKTRVQFNYEVIRLWQRPVKPFLKGGLGLLPLAPLCQLPPGVPLEQALADVVRQIDRRLRAEADQGEAARLMMGVYVLTGLRVPREMAPNIFRGVGLMQDSSTYLLLLEEGEIKGKVGAILRIGRNRLGPPDTVTEAALKAIKDLERLDRLTDAVLTVNCWQELLATP
jgi:hypothetical protein